MCRHRFSIVLLLLVFVLTTGPGALGSFINPVGQSIYATGVGDTAANFTLPEWFTRQPVSLYDFAGKIVLLDFFLYYCSHCQVAASELEPNIQEYYESRGGNPAGIPVQLIAISGATSNPEQTTAFIQNYGLDLALDDASRTVYDQFKLGGFPLFVLINGAAGANYGQWEILYHVSGYSAGDYSKVRTVIDSVTPEPTTVVFMGLGAMALLRRGRR